LLFAEDSSHYAEKMRGVYSSARLLARPPEYWTGLVRRTMLDAPAAVVRAAPSAARSAALAAAEKAREGARAAQLGEAGLAALGRALEAATAANDAPVPDEVFLRFRVPDVTTIPFIPVASAVYPPRLAVGEDGGPSPGAPRAPALVNASLPRLFSQPPVQGRARSGRAGCKKGKGGGLLCGPG
jgi:hypothetical protein